MNITRGEVRVVRDEAEAVDVAEAGVEGEAVAEEDLIGKIKENLAGQLICCGHPAGEKKSPLIIQIGRLLKLASRYGENLDSQVRKNVKGNV